MQVSGTEVPVVGWRHYNTSEASSQGQRIRVGRQRYMLAPDAK